MMKRSISIFLIILIVLQLFVPINGDAITLGEYESKLAQFKKESEDNKNALNMTQSQINATNKEIDNLKNEMNKLISEVKTLNNEIDEYNETIKRKLEESKQIIEYMQLSSGENAYLEYVFKADSTEDLIYRSAVVKELVDYNTRAIDEMKQLISDNEQRQKDIESRKKDIDKKEAELAIKLESLGETKDSYNETSVSIAQQIKTYDDLVNSYKKLGCKSNDVIGVDCAVRGEAGIFRRPTNSGYVTQEAYYTKSYTHRGLDVGSRNGRGEKIYPVANGRIVEKGYDIYGALIVAVEHYVSSSNTWYTSLYVHMSSFAPNINKGDYVTTEQYLGYMGDTGKAYGVHLHLEIFPCRMNNLGDRNCSSYGNFLNYGGRLMADGYKGPRALITFPSGTYNSWYSR